MDDHQKLKHQSELTRREAMYKSASDSDFAAVQIGIFVMKAVISVNGAALIAVLAAFPPLQNVASFKGAVPTIGLLYVGGIAAGLLGAIIAYSYQSVVTANEWNKIHEAYPDGVNPPPFPWANKAAMILALPMIGFIFVSFVLFCFGSWYLLEAFSLR